MEQWLFAGAIIVEAGLPLALCLLMGKAERRRVLALPLGASAALFALYAAIAASAYADFRASNDPTDLMGVSVFVMGFAVYAVWAILAFGLSLFARWPASVRGRLALGAGSTLPMWAVFVFLLLKRL